VRTSRPAAGPTDRRGTRLTPEIECEGERSSNGSGEDAYNDIPGAHASGRGRTSTECHAPIVPRGGWMGQSCTAWGRGILSHRQILIKAADNSVMRAADPALRLGPA
jgi:hypothetical protein